MRISLSYDNMSSTPTAKPKKQINLLRGWPNPALLPTPALLRASQIALSDPSVSVPGLLYGPDPGYQPLREEIAKWMKRFYSVSNSEESVTADAERICITGGASQNLACVLQVFSDPLKTRVWMVAPCYYMACRIFEDAGVLMNAVGEGSEGIDLVVLERGFERCKREEGNVKVSWEGLFLFGLRCLPLDNNLRTIGHVTRITIGMRVESMVLLQTSETFGLSISTFVSRMPGFKCSC
jgi:DNA-binding transcriptional MocR family regulator